MVVPRFINQALNNESLTVYGDGKQSRCFCDVADIVWAVIQLMENSKAVGQVFNLGSEENTTILNLAEQVIAKTNSSSDIRFIPYEEAYAPGFEDMRKRVPSLTKLRDLIGYSPKYSLDQILERIIKYNMENNRSSG
jgi:UDP-glucose 4-epimerase